MGKEEFIKELCELLKKHTGYDNDKVFIQSLRIYIKIAKPPDIEINGILL